MKRKREALFTSALMNLYKPNSPHTPGYETLSSFQKLMFLQQLRNFSMTSRVNNYPQNYFRCIGPLPGEPSWIKENGDPLHDLPMQLVTGFLKDANLPAVLENLIKEYFYSYNDRCQPTDDSLASFITYMGPGEVGDQKVSAVNHLSKGGFELFLVNDMCQNVYCEQIQDHPQLGWIMRTEAYLVKFTKKTGNIWSTSMFSTSSPAVLREGDRCTLPSVKNFPEVEYTIYHVSNFHCCATPCCEFSL